MPDLADLVNDLIALIPEDGSRITNDEIRTALEREAGEAISDEDLKELKSQVVALGAAEGVKGPGGGLRAPGIDPPPQAAAPAAGTRTRRSGNGNGPAAPQAAIAPGTTAASVLTGELRNQIDRIWDAFWSGGIANPLEVLEQLTYLLFIRRLDELETLEERRSQRSGQPMRRRIFPEGADEQGRPWSDLRWSRFKQLGEAASMFKLVGERVFPFLRERTAQSFCVPKAEIAEQGYDLSLNRYKELIHEGVEHRPPLEILAELRTIEQEILQGIEGLEGMLR